MQFNDIKSIFNAISMRNMKKDKKIPKAVRTAVGAVCKGREILFLGVFEDKEIYAVKYRPNDIFGMPHVYAFDGKHAELIFLHSNDDLHSFYFEHFPES